MRVLSLFDGMSCGQLALSRSGIEVEDYYASEVDEYAIKICKKNFPSTIHLGSVTDWREWDINWNSIDLLIGGSPCQGFSLAGKQLAFDDPRSKLFFEFSDILNHIKKFNPNVKFLLENVRMKKQYLNIISDFLSTDPIMINSNLVSAQNRSRYYWCNWNVNQPSDRRIYLPDILESGVVDRTKAHCLTANYWKGTSVERYIKKGQRQIAFTEARTEEAKRIRSEYKKMYGRDFCPRRGKELVPRKDGKMNCLTSTFSIKEHSLIDETLHYRKLTPIECERLQTLPDGYTDGVSNTQRYKMIGNGWTVDVISHIFNCMNANIPAGRLF